MERHKPYTAEYKLAAILDPYGSTCLGLKTHLTGETADGLGSLKLAQTEGIGKTASNLGINTNMLGRWKREHELGITQARPVFTGRGNPALTEQEKENQQLRRELEIARLLDPKTHLRAGSQERDILKKALAFFAKETR